jgi:tetratricopeptide (TPR) repeat protein
LPDDPQAAYLLAATYYNLNRYAEAAPAFEATLQRFPDLISAHFYLAASYLQLERRADARSHLERYLALAPQGELADRADALLARLRR